MWHKLVRRECEQRVVCPSSRFAGCERLPRMAHFPRWISSPAVDSSAMLGAFTHWYGSATSEDRMRVQDLYTVEHYFFNTSGFPYIRPQMGDGHVMPRRPCSDSNCHRCIAGTGGYKFRWYDKRWADTYNRSRRKGSVDLPLPGGAVGRQMTLEAHAAVVIDGNSGLGSSSTWCKGKGNDDRHAPF